MAREVTALAPWFGTNRTLAHRVGEAMKGCRWVAVPFAGGMTELLYIDAPSIVVSDTHRHIINLASVAKDPDLGPRLYRIVKRAAFDQEVLSAAQNYCEHSEPSLSDPPAIRLTNAVNYFIAVWMNRSAKAGTDGEFSGKLPVRWNANGGDSNTRYRSAVKALIKWRRTFSKCNFVILDCFEMLAKVDDVKEHGIYCDPPFPHEGDKYKHKFTPEMHKRLAIKLDSFKHCRVVCRFYDCELIRELYPETRWKWIHLTGRDQANALKPEVLVIKNGL